MLTVDLEKTLIRKKVRRIAKEEEALKPQALLDAQVERIIKENDEQYQRDLYKTLGLNHKLEQAEEINRSRRNLNALNLPKERVFHIDEIRDLCVKYGLRFLETRYYKGEIPSNLGAHIEDFRKLAPEKPYAEYCYGDKAEWEFRIAAPEDSFVLQERPKDPLLFARLGKRDWYLVHKWGNDLSVFRRIKGFLFKAYFEENWNHEFKAV